MSKILVTYGSKRGGTEGIAHMLADEFKAHDNEVTVIAADLAPDPTEFDAVVVGSSLYAGHWRHEARHFVKKNREVLRHKPVWFFSSGPLDDSADAGDLPPERQPLTLGTSIGVRGFVTFGGCLEPDAHGVLASQMSKTMSGDWRNRTQIERWARHVSEDLNSEGERK